MATVTCYPNMELAEIILEYYVNAEWFGVADNEALDLCIGDFASTLSYVIARLDNWQDGGWEEEGCPYEEKYSLTEKGKTIARGLELKEKICRCEATLEEYQEYLTLKPYLPEE